MKRLKISEKKMALLAQCNIHSIQDLLHYYPYRYEKNLVLPIQKWEEKMKVCFEGVLISKVVTRYLGGKRSISTAKVMVSQTEVHITLFNQPWFTHVKLNTAYTFFGVVSGYHQVIVQKYNTVALQHQQAIEPQYSKKEGLSNQDIRKYIQKAYSIEPPLDWIPEKYIEKYQLISKQQAIYHIHFPENEKRLRESIRYLKYEEFLKFQIAVQQFNIQKNIVVKQPKQLFNIEKYIQNLPFELSKDQQVAIAEIRNDLQSQQCMYRLVQGDVGSGKTIVAFLSMLSVTTQTALLAPTEILARQHYENFKKLNDDVVLLVGNMPQSEKAKLIAKIKNNEVKHVIGTHAIFQESIQFHDLGLAIIDEQQRFGVMQRKTLLAKGNEMDVLIMSATPIPRTLALVLYNDTAISSIKTLPKQKKKIHSYLMKSNSVKPLLPLIEEKIQQQQQVYVVCPAIEKNELAVRNVEEVYHSFQIVAKNKYQVGILHGKMKQEEKNIVMEKFLRKEIQLLVTTTVIEVGVDVASANMMIIYDANRFGLSQLHQLRGRCGRGKDEGYCYFLTDENDEETLQKLNILIESQDGFQIAEHDLKLRGPGDVLGVKQSGLPSFVLGDLIQDQKMMQAAKNDALEILNHLEAYPMIEETILNQYNTYID